MEKLEHSYIPSETVKWCSHSEKQFGNSSINYIELPYDPGKPKRIENKQTKTCTWAFTAALFIHSQQLACLPIDEWINKM